MRQLWEVWGVHRETKAPTLAGYLITDHPDAVRVPMPQHFVSSRDPRARMAAVRILERTVKHLESRSIALREPFGFKQGYSVPIVNMILRPVDRTGKAIRLDGWVAGCFEGNKKGIYGTAVSGFGMYNEDGLEKFGQIVGVFAGAHVRTEAETARDASVSVKASMKIAGCAAIGKSGNKSGGASRLDRGSLDGRDTIRNGGRTAAVA